MVEYTQLSKGIFSNKVASETKEKTEIIRKDDKKIVMRIFFPKVFQFRLDPVGIGFVLKKRYDLRLRF